MRAFICSMGGKGLKMTYGKDKENNEISAMGRDGKHGGETAITHLQIVSEMERSSEWLSMYVIDDELSNMKGDKTYIDQHYYKGKNVNSDDVMISNFTSKPS